MKHIESPSNPEIKNFKKAISNPNRDFFHVEGTRLVREGLASGVRFRAVYSTSYYMDRNTEIARLLNQAGIEPVIVSERVMKSISDVETPPGIVGVGQLEAAQPSGTDIQVFAALLFSIRDPGNFGTILRVAEATGCETIVYTQDCVEPFQPKVIRASMGSIFRVPLMEIAEANAWLQQMQLSGMHTYALSAAGEEDFFYCDFRAPALFVIGSESHGLPVDLAVEKRVTIPMKGKVESLNAAMAAAIALYHASRTLRQ